MRSNVLSAVAAGALMVMGGATALAQDATPVAQNLFEELGLPELTVTVTEEGFALSETEVAAGRYLVSLNDETGNPDIAAGFVRLVDGKTVDDLSAADEMASGTPMPEEGPPPEEFAWLFETYIAGGVSASAPYAVIDLLGGEYGVWGDDPTSSIPATGLTVTGDPEAAIEGPAPETTVSILEEGVGGQGFSFVVEGELQSGPQIVEIVNNSDQPHFVIAFQYPEEITIEQAMEFVMFDPSSGATPGPDALDETLFSFPGYAPVQSAGTTQWNVFNLGTGQAILVCFVPDPLAGGIPHAFEGMVSLVPVAG